MKVHLSIFALKLVVMETSRNKLQNLVKIDNIHANTFHLVKNIVKIGPVDHEISLLDLKKERN